MSIIQDALKKIQTQDQERPGAEPVVDLRPQTFPENKSESPAPTIKPREIPRKKMPRMNKDIVFIPMAAFVLLLILVYSGKFIWKKGVEDASKTKTAAPSQDITFRPMAGAGGTSPDGSAVSSDYEERMNEVKEKYSNLALSGIMYLEDYPMAIIDDNVVRVGDTVNGAEVTNIAEDNVVLESNGVEITLRIK